MDSVVYFRDWGREPVFFRKGGRGSGNLEISSPNLTKIPEGPMVGYTEYPAVVFKTL